MSTTAASTWAIATTDAAAFLARLRGHLRTWAALQHARSMGGAVSGYWYAAYEAVRRPVRVSIVTATGTATEREQADATADDLWDAVANARAFVRWARRRRRTGSPALEPLEAEVRAAEKWLADYPISVAIFEAAAARKGGAVGTGSR